MLLFLITYVAQLIFEALEDRYVIENDIIMYRKVFSRSIRRTSQRKKAVQCVTISLYEKGVNKSATTSGIQEKRSTASTVANVSKKLAGKWDNRRFYYYFLVTAVTVSILMIIMKFVHHGGIWVGLSVDSSRNFLKTNFWGNNYMFISSESSKRKAVITEQHIVANLVIRTKYRENREL